MAEYIEREALLKHIDIHCGYCGEARHCICEAPAASVVEVVHGRWISHEGYEECNICHHKAMFEHNYCPNCGAKMDGERKNQGHGA